MRSSLLLGSSVVLTIVAAGSAVACPAGALCVAFAQDVALRDEAPAARVAPRPLPTPERAIAALHLVDTETDPTLNVTIPTFVDPTSFDAVWNTLRDGVESRLPSYQGNGYTLMLSPVVVQTAFVKLPGIGISGEYFDSMSELDVEVHRGTQAAAGAPPDLVIEIPHGATLTADFERVRAQLTSPLPDGLVDFFHVNTDAGAPELGTATARAIVAAAPTRVVVVLRCRIPRTFIDCNRRIDASPAEFAEGKVTPGLMPWITTPEDRALLRGAYDRYVTATREAMDLLAPTGAILLLHTYAPRTVDVQVDLDIVRSLRHAYEPAVEPTWPLRPEVDVIATDLAGVSHAPPAVLAALHAELAAAGIPVADGTTYPLHPSTLAWDHVQRKPGRALCIEVRRDLVADPFEPFAQMRISAEKVARIAAPLATALRAWW